MKITLLTGKTFDISEAVGMDIKVVQAKGARKLTLRIDSKERVPILSVPKWCSKKHAVGFINEHMDWLIENLSKMPPIKHFTDGMEISLFGQKVQIKHCPNERRGTWLENNTLYVSGSAEFLHRRVKDYIKKQAEAEFFKISLQLATIIGQKLNSVCIKDTKSRWGSCSSLHNINYSWRIALAPKEVIDYLMAHEVAHLKHQDNSSEFWECVGMLNPNWQTGHKWLKKNGKLLYTYQ